MKKLTIKILLICMIVVLFTSFGSCAKSSEEEAEKVYDSDEYTTYILPGVFSLEICFDSEVTTNIFVSEDFNEADSSTWELKPEYGVKYDTNPSGGIIYFTANDEQSERMYDVARIRLEDAKNRLMKCGEIQDVEWAEDYSSITISVSEDRMSTSYFVDYARLETMCYVTRMFYTKDKDVTIKSIYKNYDTGYLLSSHNTPYGRMAFTEEDWDKSETEDVTVSSRFVDDISFSGTLESMSDPYVYIIPDDPSVFDEYVTGDTPIEKVVLSYEDVFIGYKSEPGDRFNVRVAPPEVADYSSGSINVKTDFCAPEDAKIEE